MDLSGSQEWILDSQQWILGSQVWILGCQGSQEWILGCQEWILGCQQPLSSSSTALPHLLHAGERAQRASKAVGVPRGGSGVHE